LSEQHAWLFAPWIELEGFRDNYDEKYAEVDRLRGNALSEILDRGGFEGVLELARIVESPGHVGATLARCELIDDDLILPELLRAPDPKLQ